MLKTVLIVEDDQDILNIYQTSFSNKGFNVDTASDGEEAIDKIIRGGYDAVLLDIMIPKIDGLGILERLKSTKLQRKNGPIILLTNLSDKDVIDKGLKSGAKDYVIKTDITPHELVAKIEAIT